MSIKKKITYVIIALAILAATSTGTIVILSNFAKKTEPTSTTAVKEIKSLVSQTVQAVKDGDDVKAKNLISKASEQYEKLSEDEKQSVPDFSILAHQVNNPIPAPSDQIELTSDITIK